MATTKNDGGIQFGTQVVTIGSTPYVLESANLNDPSTTEVTRDEDGVPNGQYSHDDPVTGSGTLQLLGSVGWPEKYAEFSYTPAGSTTDVSVYLDSIGETTSNTSAKKLPITFRKLINP